MADNTVSHSALAVAERLKSASLILEKLALDGSSDDAELQAAIEVIKKAAKAAADATGQSAEAEPLAPTLFILSEEEAAQILALSDELRAVSPSASPEQFCRTAHRLARRLPERLLETLADFAFRGSDSGFLLLKGLPQPPGEGPDATPPTPGDNKAHVGETTVLARCQAIINHVTGQSAFWQASRLSVLTPILCASPQWSPTKLKDTGGSTRTWCPTERWPTLRQASALVLNSNCTQSKPSPRSGQTCSP